MRNVHWLLELSIDPSQCENFITLMKELVIETDKEWGAMAYEYNFNGDGTVCHVYERFSDSDAAMVHMGLFVDCFAERFLASCNVTGITLLGFPSEELVNALEGFGPRVMYQRAGFARFAG